MLLSVWFAITTFGLREVALLAMRKRTFRNEWIKLGFDISEKIQAQSLALDYVLDNGEPKVVEISYGFVPDAYDACVGYWDNDLNWYEGPFDPYGLDG